MDDYNIYSKFDIEQHKKHYVDYLEVIILRDGTVEYAIPSHQEYLIKLACNQHNITRDELMKRCPVEYYGDFMTWLCIQTGAVAVWNEFIIYNTVTEPQSRMLNALHNAKLYHGSLL